MLPPTTPPGKAKEGAPWTYRGRKVREVSGGGGRRRGGLSSAHTAATGRGRQGGDGGLSSDPLRLTPPCRLHLPWRSASDTWPILLNPSSPFPQPSSDRFAARRPVPHPPRLPRPSCHAQTHFLLKCSSPWGGGLPLDPTEAQTSRSGRLSSDRFY